MKLHKILMVLIILINIIGCATKNTGVVVWQKFPVLVYISDIIPENERKIIILALNEWNKQSPNIPLFIEHDENFYSHNIYQPQIFITKMNLRAPNIEGWTDLVYNGPYLGAATIYINTEVSCDLESLMLHELGHALGLKHTNQGIMQPVLAPGELRQTIDLFTTSYFNSLYPEIRR